MQHQDRQSGLCNHDLKLETVSGTPPTVGVWSCTRCKITFARSADADPPSARPGPDALSAGEPRVGTEPRG